MRGSFKLYGFIVLILFLASLLGSLYYFNKISGSLATLESRPNTTLTVTESNTVEIPQEVYWALDDLWKATEQTQRVINENRFQIDSYYYQLDDLNARLQAVEEELNSFLSEQRWN